MINFKELFQSQNQKKILELFKQHLNDLSEENMKKYSNFIDKDGNTLLHHAMNNNCFLLADFFYKNNIGTNIINNDGQEILHTISEGKIIKYTVESDASGEFSDDINNEYKDIQSETELNKSFFSEKNKIIVNDNKNIPENQIGGQGQVYIPAPTPTQINKDSIKEIIKYTKNKKDKYVEEGKKLIEYTQNIANNSKNITKIGKLYNLNLDKPNDILFAKYKQAGLYDYITNKFPKLLEKEMIKLLDYNINKEILDSIDTIRVKNKIMKCFKILKQ
jgi:ankyrin repeat protein